MSSRQSFVHRETSMRVEQDHLPPSPSNAGIQQLLNMSVEQFLELFWERRFCHFDAENALPVTSIEEIDHMVSNSVLRPSDVRLVKNGLFAPSTEYTERAGSIRESRVRMAAVLAFFEQGYTVVIYNTGAYSERIRRVCSRLGDEIGAACRANLYLTPARSRGLPPHCDTHCVICHQVHGSKHWTIYKNPLPLPTLNSHPPRKQTYSQEVESEVDLRTGQAIYIPRGTVHSASSSSDVSAHLTFGFHVPCVADYFRKAVSILEKEDVNFRRSLRVPVSRPSGERSLSIDNNLEIAEHIALRALAAAFKDLSNNATSTPGGQLMKAALGTNITERTPLMRAFWDPVFVCPVMDGIKMTFGGKSYDLPLDTEATLNFVIRHQGSFCSLELPGLSPERQLAVAKQLVTSGLIREAQERL
jgi:hypothetical protein